MAAIQMDANGRFGQMLASALDRKEMSVADLAARVETSYEHMRKLFKGTAYPSKELLRKVTRATGMNFEEAEEAAMRDRMEKKFGPAQVSGTIHPRMAAWEALIPQLTDAQNELLLSMVRGLIRETRRG